MAAVEYGLTGGVPAVLLICDVLFTQSLTVGVIVSVLHTHFTRILSLLMDVHFAFIHRLPRSKDKTLLPCLTR